MSEKKYDISLYIEPSEGIVGQPARMTVSLYQGLEFVPNVGENITIEVKENPSGITYGDFIEQDYEYINDLTLEEPGEYTITVTYDGETSEPYPFTIKNPEEEVLPPPLVISPESTVKYERESYIVGEERPTGIIQLKGEGDLNNLDREFTFVLKVDGEPVDTVVRVNYQVESDGEYIFTHDAPKEGLGTLVATIEDTELSEATTMFTNPVVKQEVETITVNYTKSTYEQDEGKMTGEIILTGKGDLNNQDDLVEVSIFESTSDKLNPVKVLVSSDSELNTYTFTHDVLEPGSYKAKVTVLGKTQYSEPVVVEAKDEGVVISESSKITYDHETYTVGQGRASGIIKLEGEGDLNHFEDNIELTLKIDDQPVETEVLVTYKLDTKGEYNFSHEIVKEGVVTLNGTLFDVPLIEGETMFINDTVKPEVDSISASYEKTTYEHDAKFMSGKIKLTGKGDIENKEGLVEVTIFETTENKLNPVNVTVVGNAGTTDYNFVHDLLEPGSYKAKVTALGKTQYTTPVTVEAKEEPELPVEAVVTSDSTITVAETEMTVGSELSATIKLEGTDLDVLDRNDATIFLVNTETGSEVQFDAEYETVQVNFNNPVGIKGPINEVGKYKLKLTVKGVTIMSEEVDVKPKEEGPVPPVEEPGEDNDDEVTECPVVNTDEEDELADAMNHQVEFPPMEGECVLEFGASIRVARNMARNGDIEH